MNNKQMIVYKESFIKKFLKKIKSIFIKEKLIESETPKKEVQNAATPEMKQEIMKLYEDIKAQKVNLNEVDNEKLYKVMLLLNEEIQILAEKINKEKEKMDVNLYNLNMYNKEIEILKKNA